MKSFVLLALVLIGSITAIDLQHKSSRATLHQERPTIWYKDYEIVKTYHRTGTQYYTYVILNGELRE
jgi:hypothetical protein